MYKIFLVEDDHKLCEHIKEYLQKYDYQVFIVEDFKEVENQFERLNPDLVLLDINLPYYDGYYLCRVFRKDSRVPIIFTSARASDVEQVMGIELGADDYITKPFSLQLLLAKVKASLRRTYGEYVTQKSSVITINGLVLNGDNFKVTFKNKELEFSKNEFILLKKLVEDKNKVVKREELLEIIWDDITFVEDNTLTVNVVRLKNKLKQLGIKDAIKTKRGVGYVFEFNE